MYLTEIFIISLGLSMDCFAVTLSSGICLPCLKKKDILKIAFFFGLFQGGMPILGWLLGQAFKESVSTIDHWISFTILVIIGIKMIAEAMKDNPDSKSFNIKKMFVLLSLSVATSIDAFVVGIGFAFLDVNIITAVISIGVITFFISIAGVYLGRKFGKLVKSKWAEIAGGIILIAIGTKILIEHIYLQ